MKSGKHNLIKKLQFSRLQNSNLYFGGIIMKIVKIILSIVTMLFALLGLLRVISFDIANPIMFLALATLLVLRSIEYKKDRDNSGFILTIFTAIFLYIVVIYNVFIG